MESNGDRIDCYSDICESASINDPDVIKIEEHEPAGDGDKLFYSIFYGGNIVLRVFNPNTVSYEKDTSIPV